MFFVDHVFGARSRKASKYSRSSRFSTRLDVLGVLYFCVLHLKEMQQFRGKETTTLKIQILKKLSSQSLLRWTFQISNFYLIFKTCVLGLFFSQEPWRWLFQLQPYLKIPKSLNKGFFGSHGKNICVDYTTLTLTEQLG